MKLDPAHPLRRMIPGLIICVEMIAGRSVIAQSTVNTWSGIYSSVPLAGDAKWSSDQNWVTQSAPPKDGTADIVFTGQTGLAPDMDSAWNVHSITFLAPAGAFICVGHGNTLTIQSGITNLSTEIQTIGAVGNGSPITLGASNTWDAGLGALFITAHSPINNNGNDLTITGTADTSIFPKMTGAGKLIKTGTGNLFLGQGGAFNDGFTGTIIINQGKLQINGSGTVRKTAGVTLNGGVLELNRANSIGYTNATMTFNGGKLVANSKTNDLNASDIYGQLILTANSSIDLDSSNATPAVLSFAGGSRTGGTLTINGWAGVAGQPGTDDKIIFRTAPDGSFLDAVRFTGFAPGAAYLAGTSEIVPLAATPPLPPTLVSPERVSGTEFQFTLNGTAGQTYIIESSTDLINWSPVLTVNTVSNSIPVVDANATNEFNFYRALLSP